MPDRRRHRGKHPDDARLFSVSQHEALRDAVSDLSWLLTRDYATPSAVKLVGDRYSLTSRQRNAVGRSACSDESLVTRAASERQLPAPGVRRIHVDAYNVLITVESLLAGAYLFRGRDGCIRDVASLHGTYRLVEETPRALEEIGALIRRLDIEEAVWLLDAPVSNSGRLASQLRELAAQRGWQWSAHVVQNPDRELVAATSEPVASTTVVASSDSWVLERCGAWCNLVAHLIDAHAGDDQVIDLAPA